MVDEGQTVHQTLEAYYSQRAQAKTRARRPSLVIFLSLYVDFGENAQ